MEPLWGIDLGGTKIEGVVIEQLNPIKVIARLRLPTEREKGYEHVITQITKVVDSLKQETGLQPKHIGIGTPGTLDPQTQTMKNSNTTILNGMPLHSDLEKALGIPVAMANDANCFAVAEARMGAVVKAVPDAKVVFGVIMGTGVGGGLVINGQVRNGQHGIAGEWGHSFLDESGGPCYCGLTGCIEQIISGPALERYYKAQSGNHLSLRDIYQHHLDGTDPIASETIQRLIHFFGKAIASVVNMLDPDAIVLGGGVGNIDLLYTEGVKKAAHFSFNPSLNTAFLKPELGDSAGVFGAALLWA